MGFRIILIVLTNSMQVKKKTLIFGRHPVVDAIQAGQVFDKIILQQGTRGEFEKELRQLTKIYNIPLQYAPKERLEKITRANHQGVIGFLSMIQYYRLEDVLPLIYERGEVPLLLLLDGITDVRNFGAIARSAVCCGTQSIIIPMKGGAQINADAMKASAGAISSIPICREPSLVNVLEQLQNSGVQVVASNPNGRKQLYELDFNLPTAIILGSEGEGVSETLLEKADEQFVIPQTDLTNSFNVSVASGIILYEAIKQRMFA